MKFLVLYHQFLVQLDKDVPSRVDSSVTKIFDCEPSQLDQQIRVFATAHSHAVPGDAPRLIEMRLIPVQIVRLE